VGDAVIESAVSMFDRPPPRSASGTAHAAARRGSGGGRLSWRRLILSAWEYSGEEGGEQRETLVLIE
jgi:hypothetical protein